MKRLVVALLVALAVAAGGFSSRCARAADGAPDTSHAEFGLGFHKTNTPIGGRLWSRGQRMGIDLGFGYHAEDTALEDGRSTVFVTLVGDFGVPITAARWDKLRFIVRPGFTVQSEDAQVAAAVDDLGNVIRSDVAKYYTYTASGEFEVEYYVTSRFTASCGYGAEFSHSKLDYPNTGSLNTSGTTATSLFQVGFHLYVWQWH